MLYSKESDGDYARRGILTNSGPLVGNSEVISIVSEEEVRGLIIIVTVPG